MSQPASFQGAGFLCPLPPAGGLCRLLPLLPVTSVAWRGPLPPGGGALSPASIAACFLCLQLLFVACVAMPSVVRCALVTGVCVGRVGHRGGPVTPLGPIAGCSWKSKPQGMIPSAAAEGIGLQPQESFAERMKRGREPEIRCCRGSSSRTADGMGKRASRKRMTVRKGGDSPSVGKGCGLRGRKEVR